MVSKPDDPNYKCPGCQRAELHFMCPAYDTHFYMSGIPYTENVARIYDHLDPDDKQIFFDLLQTNRQISIQLAKDIAEALYEIPISNKTIAGTLGGMVPKKDTEWHSDESWCPNCQTYTTHRIKWGGHERDSTHDQSICTVCDWRFNGYTGEYEQPYTDI
jgi:hypothetical protein